jgi:TrmH family RNA methyltransferase
MDDTSVIRSASNPAFRRARAVSAGKAKDALLLEGERLIEDALRGGLELELVLVASNLPDLARRWTAAGLPVRTADDGLVQRASTLATSPGSLALARRAQPLGLDALLARCPATPLLLVVAGVADPGNLGALARSAEAAGCAGLVVVAGGASPWNAKALRGSMGSLLRLAVAEEPDAAATARALTGAGFRQLAAATRGGARPETVDWAGPTALWIGGERGDEPLAPGLAPVTLPMAGAVESLNVTVAASVLLFAAAAARGGAAEPRP